MVGMGEDGHYFYLSASSDPSKLSRSIWGHHHHSAGFLDAIETTDFDFGQFEGNLKHVGLKFTTARGDYRTVLHLLPNHFDEFAGRPWRLRSTVHLCQLTVNARQGRAFVVSTQLYDGECPLGKEASLPLLSAPDREALPAESEKLVLLFNEEACRFEGLVGGKGASLSLLTSTMDNSPVDCQVPAGFCVTLSAWKLQMLKQDNVRIMFKNIEEAANRLVEKNLEDLCSKASSLIADLPVDPVIQTEIKSALKVVQML